MKDVERWCGQPMRVFPIKHSDIASGRSGGSECMGERYQRVTGSTGFDRAVG